MPFQPTTLSNLWGWWRVSNGAVPLMEQPYAEVQWDVSGLSLASSLGIGTVTPSILNPSTNAVDTFPTFTIVSGDTDAQIAAKLIAAVRSFPMGYKIGLVGNVVYFRAKSGGAIWNGQALTLTGQTGTTSTGPLQGGSDTVVTSNKLKQIIDDSGTQRDFIRNTGNELIIVPNGLNGKAIVAKGVYGGKPLSTVQEFPDTRTTGLTAFIVIRGWDASSLFANSSNFYINKLAAANNGNFIANSTGSAGTSTGFTYNTWLTIRLRATATNAYLSINNGAEQVLAITQPTSFLADVVTMFSDSATGHDFAEAVLFNQNKPSSEIALVEYMLNQEYKHYTWTGSVPTGYGDVQAVIIFPSLTPKTVGDVDFDPGATSNSSASIQYTSSNPAVASIVNGKVRLVSAGSATITASQSATTGYTAADPVGRDFSVAASLNSNPAPQVARPGGLWFMDGIDLFQVFSLAIEEGTADFLRWPARKESITHDWLDSNGIDVDLSRVFLKERRGTLKMYILAYSEADFWNKHRQFFANLTQPGLRRLEFVTHPNKSYFVYYEETPTYNQVTKLQAYSGQRLVAHAFNLVIVEPTPQEDVSNVFIVTDDGRFLIS